MIRESREGCSAYRDGLALQNIVPAAHRKATTDCDDERKKKHKQKDQQWLFFYLPSHFQFHWGSHAIKAMELCNVNVDHIQQKGK